MSVQVKASRTDNSATGQFRVRMARLLKHIESIEKYDRKSVK